MINSDCYNPTFFRITAVIPPAITVVIATRKIEMTKRTRFLFIRTYIKKLIFILEQNTTTKLCLPYFVYRHLFPLFYPKSLGGIPFSRFPTFPASPYKPNGAGQIFIFAFISRLFCIKRDKKSGKRVDTQIEAKTQGGAVPPFNK